MGNELFTLLKKKIPEDAGIVIPPRIFEDMEGELVEYVDGLSLTVRFPVKERYQNPYGFVQGGIVVAAVDNTIGPLSFLLATPSVTSQLNATFIRPIGPEQKYLLVKATVIEKTKKNIHLQADVVNESGKLCVKCFASCAFVSE